MRCLKLCPTGLGSGIDKDRADYTVFCGEWNIINIGAQSMGGNGLIVSFGESCLGVQSRSEVGWIVSESPRLVCPSFADVLVSHVGWREAVTSSAKIRDLVGGEVGFEPSLDTKRQITLACALMPRPARLPSLEGVDPTDLMLAVLTVLDRRNVGPEFRKLMHAQLGDCLEAGGGARKVLTEALAALRRSPFVTRGVTQANAVKPSA